MQIESFEKFSDFCCGVLMMTKKKYYAVKIGRKPGIYQTWAECEEQVKGIGGAVYKGFLDMESAEKYMQNSEDVTDEKEKRETITNNDIQVSINELKNDEVIAFVDGSYLDAEKKAGFGVIIIDNTGLETPLYRAYTEKISPDLIEMRNFAAEILGAMEAVNWAVSYSKKKITIYYDCEGIEKLITGEWRAKNAFSKKYVSFVKDKNSIIDIRFVKVPAHCGIDYNEKADALAKRSLLEKGYKSYNDGSVYFVGYSSEDWKSIVEYLNKENMNLKGEVSKKIHLGCEVLPNEKNRIEITTGKNKVVINCYNNVQSYVQGKQSPLFEKIVSTAISMLKKDEIVIETLNKIHTLSITKEEIETEFENMLPDYRGDREGKHYNNLLSAIYNTRLLGYMPDYTCLVTPIFRAYEKYLHAILGKLMGLTTCKENGTNNFSYFSKNDFGKYECNSPAITILNCDQKEYLNVLYNKYNGIRHQYSHWSADDYDSAVITELSVAQDYIKEGLTIINNYYKLF